MSHSLPLHAEDGNYLKLQYLQDEIFGILIGLFLNNLRVMETLSKNEFKRAFQKVSILCLW